MVECPTVLLHKCHANGVDPVAGAESCKNRVLNSRPCTHDIADIIFGGGKNQFELRAIHESSICRWKCLDKITGIESIGLIIYFSRTG